MHARSTRRRFATILISIDDCSLGSCTRPRQSRGRGRERRSAMATPSSRSRRQQSDADRPARDRSAHRIVPVRRRRGAGPDPRGRVGQPEPRDRPDHGEGAGCSQGATGRRRSSPASAAVEAQCDRQGRGDGPARAGELSPRRDPGVQPGGLQHGRLPRHADGQGGVPAEPAGLSARPGLRHPVARGGRPADQPDRPRDQPDPAQAAGRGPARGGPAAGPQLQEL